MCGRVVAGRSRHRPHRLGTNTWPRQDEMSVCAATTAHELAALSSMRPLVPAAQGAGRKLVGPGAPIFISGGCKGRTG